MMVLNNRILPVLIALTAISILSFVSTRTEAADIWSRGDIAGLFPPAPEGWTASRLDLEALKLPTTDFEQFVNVLNGKYDAGTSIRIRAKRHYKLEDQKITVTIDSNDIDSAINIDAITSAFSSGDQTTREWLENDGYTAVTHKGFAGVAMTTPDKTGRAYRVGSAGVVALECSYFDCENLIAQMAEEIDFESVAEFAAFNHRKQEE